MHSATVAALTMCPGQRKADLYSKQQRLAPEQLLLLSEDKKHKHKAPKHQKPGARGKHRLPGPATYSFRPPSTRRAPGESTGSPAGRTRAARSARNPNARRPSRIGRRASTIPPMPSNRSLRLVAIGVAGGLFSGLLGVGGGVVIVPLLMLWLSYDERHAAGTSLAAIVFVAAFAAALQGIYGNVRPLPAALLGIPAVGGAMLGTHIQQRLATRSIALLFAALLIASAVELLLQ